MNPIKRAFLYVTRKRGKSLLLTSILFVVSTLVLCGLATLDAEDKKSTELRGATGTSFTVNRTESWGDGESGEQGNFSNYNKSELITDDMIDKIANTAGIKGYNAVYEAVLNLYDQNQKRYGNDPSTGQGAMGFRSYGSMDTQYSSYFLAREVALVEGRHISKEDENSVIISEDTAKKYGLKLGDKISAVNDPLNNDPYVELEVVGIFEVLADSEDVKDQWSMDAWYDYNTYAFVSMDSMKELLVNYQTDGPNKGYISADFYVNDPSQLDNVIQKVQEIDGIQWDSFEITANDKVYERTASSMSDISTLIQIMITVIVVISMGIVTLILTMWIKSRVKETGILMASGISKVSILFQHITEVGMIAIISFPLSYLYSNLVAGIVGEWLGKTGNIIVTSNHFSLVCGFGALLLIIAILVSCISTLRMKPKEILSKMD